jgi:hypothetical protein
MGVQSSDLVCKLHAAEMLKRKGAILVLLGCQLQLNRLRVHASQHQQQQEIHQHP